MTRPRALDRPADRPQRVPASLLGDFASELARHYGCHLLRRPHPAVVWRALQALAQRVQHRRRQYRRRCAVASPQIAEAVGAERVVAGEDLLHPAPREARQLGHLLAAASLRKKPDHLVVSRQGRIGAVAIPRLKLVDIKMSSHLCHACPLTLAGRLNVSIRLGNPKNRDSITRKPYDPLAIGGLLLDAFRLAMLPDRESVDERIAGDVLSGAQTGLQHFLISGILEMPPSRRLAFRELGLAIGLQTISLIAAVEKSASLLGPDPSQMLSPEAGEDLGDQLVEFWYRLQRQSEPLWLEHADINDVMLATALLRAQIGTS